MGNPSLSSQALPTGFRQEWLDLSPGRVRLIAGGPPQAPALILVHGLGGSAEDFLAVASGLAGHRRCYIPDLPGYGLSEQPDAPYSIEYFALVLEEMSARLALGRPAWVGHSMGGQIVLWLAAHRPGLVERLAAICPAGGQTGPALLHHVLMLAATRGDRLRAYSPWLARQCVAMVFDELGSRQPSPACRQVQDRVVALWNGPGRRRRERALIRSARQLLSHPVFNAVHAINAPVLLIAGQGDRIVPRLWTDRLRLHLPAGAGYLEVPGGHMPVYLAVEELSSALGEFLGEEPA